MICKTLQQQQQQQQQQQPLFYPQILQNTNTIINNISRYLEGTGT